MNGNIRKKKFKNTIFNILEENNYNTWNMLFLLNILTDVKKILKTDIFYN